MKKTILFLSIISIFISCQEQKNEQKSDVVDTTAHKIQEQTSATTPETKEVQKIVNNPYLKKYAGGYTIEVKGISSKNEAEAYALAENGNATWMWIENDSKGGANITSKKTGIWTGDENKISVKINGNSGKIVEEYVLKNGVFVSTFSKDRYLKRSN